MQPVLSYVLRIVIAVLGISFEIHAITFYISDHNERVESMHHKVIIIGAGPAGYTAGIYAARANLKPVLFTGMQPGGQLTITTDVENYPGFAEVIQGPWLMTQMQAQAQHVGVKLIEESIAAVDFGRRPFVLTTDRGQQHTADAVIICTGAQAKWLGIPSEEKFRGFGVSACATCDGFFYRDKTVMVVGGGNTASEEALYLTNHARQVYLVHRRDQLRGDKMLHDRVMAHPQIKVIWNHVVDEILGAETPPSVERVRLRDTITGALQELAIDGLFVAIGHTPMTSLFQKQLELDEGGYIRTEPGTTLTNIPGVFAAGDVQDKVYRQAVTAAGQGCMAALDAERYLSALV
jgi:thioredoxin reductase (NADPH)